MARLAHPVPLRVPAGLQPADPGLWFCNWTIWLDARQRLERALAPLGLRARDYWLLGLAAAGPIAQHEMAHLAGLDPSSLVSLLDRLERQGWLRRERNPGDRRVQFVRRTEAGDRLFARAAGLAQEAESEQLQALLPAERRRLLTLVRKLMQRSRSTRTTS